MEKGYRRTKDRIFLVESRYKAMNRIIILYGKIESKSSAFGIKKTRGRREDFFVSLLWSVG